MVLEIIEEVVEALQERQAKSVVRLRWEAIWQNFFINRRKLGIGFWDSWEVYWRIRLGELRLAKRRIGTFSGIIG